MDIKKALLLSCLMVLPVALLAQPQVASTNADGYNARGRLMQDKRNYVGSTHQLAHHNNYLSPSWNDEIEAEYLMAINEFELGKPETLTMLEEFIENHPYEPLAMNARAKPSMMILMKMSSIAGPIAT